MAKRKSNGPAIPCESEAEGKIIGTMLGNREAIEQARKFLSAEDFWDEAAGAIFTACVQLLEKGEPVTQESILEFQDTEVSTKDLRHYISWAITLADAVEFASNVSRVKNAVILRHLMSLGNKILKDAVTEDADAAVILQDADSSLNAIQRRATMLPPRIVGLEIVTTNPRSYYIKLSNGRRAGISIDDLLNAGRVKRIITNALDFVPALPKDWETFIRRLMQTASVCPASGVDVSLDVLDAIRDLFAVRREAKAASDLRTGSYVMDEIDGKQYYLFQKRPVVDYVKQHLTKDIDSVQLWRIVQDWGAINNKEGKLLSKRVGEDTRTGLWGLPASVVVGSDQSAGEEEDDLPWD